MLDDTDMHMREALALMSDVVLENESEQAERGEKLSKLAELLEAKDELELLKLM